MKPSCIPVLKSRAISITSHGAVLAAALLLALPVRLSADTTIAQSDIESYYNDTYNLYTLDGGIAYANSGDLNFGTTDSGDNLAVGYATTGNSLTISGGTVSDYHGIIGCNSGSGGAVTVTGSGSEWYEEGDLYVGNSGTGTLDIENGGHVWNLGNGYIAYASGSTGTTTVGAGSSWINTGFLHVGLGGTGTLEIKDGGTVSNTYGVIASSGGSGTVIVTGAGSTWTSTSIEVGRSGTGTLRIENGGAVNCSYEPSSIALYEGGTGAVTVTGSKSIWYNSFGISVGSGGTGTLTIEDGALVLAASLSMGSGGNLYIGGGYLALSGDQRSAIDTLLSGDKVYAWDGTEYVLVNSSNKSSLVSVNYYDVAGDAYAATGYNGLDGYTVLTSIDSVPEPATYAFFGGIGALALAIRRRKKTVA